MPKVFNLLSPRTPWRLFYWIVCSVPVHAVRDRSWMAFVADCSVGVSNQAKFDSDQDRPVLSIIAAGGSAQNTRKRDYYM